MEKLKFLLAASIGLASLSHAAEVNKLTVGLLLNERIWSEFSKSERAAMLEKFPQLEIVPAASVGRIQSVQGVDRSTAPTNAGTVLGSAVGQAAYIDHALRPGNNYSAKGHLGVALLGAIIGSGFDSAGQRKFIFNYAIKTMDGEIREVRVESTDEFTRPVGQCVKLPDVEPVESALCSADKLAFLKRLSAIGAADADAVIGREAAGVIVKCRIIGVGVVTLDKNACLQVGGKQER